MGENKFTISNILMGISAVFMLLAFLYPNIYIFGMNQYFLNAGEYHLFAAQVFTSQFLHGSLMHLAMNAIFVLYFGNILEREMGENKFMLFFISFCIFNAFFLITFSGGNTVGISGFALAILTYFTLLLWKRGNPEYRGGVTAIVINILIGLTPGISFLGHFGGMIFGGFWWFLHNYQKKKIEL